MRTKETTRASFSDNPPVIDVKLPRAWSDFTQRELKAIIRMIVNRGEHPDSGIFFPILTILTGCRVLSRDHDTFLCRFKAVDNRDRVRRILCRVTPARLAELLDPLNFIFDPGDVPVRFDRWKGIWSVDPALHGVSFGDYLRLENLYQGYLTSGNLEAILAMAAILYPGIKECHVDKVFTFMLLQWMVQIKSMFARQWPHFFRPAPGGAGAASMLEVMNAEIRALTGGDVVKEESVFAVDCWRALTELDFKALEAEEIKRLSKK